MIPFKLVEELRIGKILEVNGTSIRVELDGDLNDLTRTIKGRVYPIGQMASIIKIHFGRRILFAYVRMLRMRSDIVLEDGQPPISPSDDSRVLEADLFGQGRWETTKNKLKFTRGVETYPLPLQAVYLTTNDELEHLYLSAETTLEEGATTPLVPIGHYVGGSNAICRADIDKLFGHHCAVLGSTGAGKSGTVAAILHSILDHSTASGTKLRPRIVLIDPHGEYAKAFGDRARVFKAYTEASSTGGDAFQLKLPYWLMSSDEFRSLVIGMTEHEATAQNNIVYDALNYARMVERGIVASLGEDPNGRAEPDLSNGYTEDEKLAFDKDKPVPFRLGDFITHIDKIQGRKPDKKDSLAASDSTRKRIEGILNKIRVLRANPQLSFLLKEYDTNAPSIQTVLSQFVGGQADGSKQDIRVVDISGLPNEVAGPLTAVIARLLFQYKLWQTKDERARDPVLFICEEAHRYVPNHGEAQYKEAQEAIRRIAKEGRKYGLGLMLVSQRPSDVESTVLSQCNSWFVMRLSNASDQEHVARFLPDSLIGLTKIISSLTRRETIFVGEAAALPSRIRIRELTKEKLPESSDISFANGWSVDPIDEDGLNTIAERWGVTAN
ncbi:MAG: ATP-binding protein [Deltaproteobacteria bacterium]|nr:ATP-binding protein [Deltaproteobacteria bacterium]